MTPIDFSSKSFLVKGITADIRKSLKRVLSDKGGELKNCGMRDWDQPVELDAETGFWRSRGMVGKPKRWILHATSSTDGSHCVEIPKGIHGAEHIGYFSNVGGTMMIMAQRIIIGLQDKDSSLFHFDPELEWVLFIAMRQCLPRGTSCEIIKSLNLSAGTLGYEGQANINSAKVAVLCLLAPISALNDKAPKSIHDSLVRFLKNESIIQLAVIDDSNNISDSISEFCSICESNITDPTPEQHHFNAYFKRDQDIETLSDTEDQQISLALSQDCRQIALWGPDLLRMSLIRQTIFNRMQKGFSHIMANQAWTESSILRVIRSLDTTVLSFEQAEHLVTAGLLPIITNKTSLEGTLLFDAAGIPVEPINIEKKFSHLVLSFTTGNSKGLRQAQRMMGSDTVWIKCATRVNPTDIVVDFFIKIDRPLPDSDRRSNAFSNMGKVLEQHIYLEKIMLVNFIRFCIGQHPEATWGTQIRGQSKAILIGAFNTIISPRLADLEHSTLLSLLNEISNTWELSLAQSQYLISSNLWR